ncbi:MAG TPA: transcriptional regulator [Planctomycetaceae bacterium]|nr:transcriptional regulator [Planctomycetaceae bacterium]
MPLYEFTCDGCDQTVELLVRSPADQPTCPTCGDDKLTKLLSIPATPSIRSGGGLPVSRAQPMGQSCAAPRCCGGGCEI